MFSVSCFCSISPWEGNIEDSGVSLLLHTHLWPLWMSWLQLMILTCVLNSYITKNHMTILWQILTKVVSRKADTAFYFPKNLSESKQSVYNIAASDPLVQRSPQTHYKPIIRTIPCDCFRWSMIKCRGNTLLRWWIIILQNEINGFTLLSWTLRGSQKCYS